MRMSVKRTPAIIPMLSVSTLTVATTVPVLKDTLEMEHFVWKSLFQQYQVMFKLMHGM